MAKRITRYLVTKDLGLAQIETVGTFEQPYWAIGTFDSEEDARRFIKKQRNKNNEE